METQPEQPQRFGSYLVLERIGDGGMAEIFLAKMTGYSGFEKYVALKKILPRYSSSPAFARMLIHEAKLAARIQHFNVVQVLDLGEIDGHVFIAMEYVRGRDLAALLSNTYRRRERLPLSISLCIALEFLTGLDFAHRMVSEDGAPLSLIHRDISPQNVLISYEGEVKLTDFGIARVIENNKGDFKLPGNLHGKFGYMSPEQVDGLPLDQRSDIFGAGVVLHEMLTGQRLFRGKTPKATIEMIRSMEIPPPSNINPDVPPEVDRICGKALARNRDARYQTVGSFLGDLSRVTDTLPQRSSRRDLAVYMKRQFGAALGERRVALSSASSGRVPLGEILVSRLGVKPSHIEIALAEQRARGGRLGELLVEGGVISDDTLARSLAMQANLQMIGGDTLQKANPPPNLARFPRTVALGTSMVPIEINGGVAVLAVADPYDTHAILEAKIILGVSETSLVVAPKSQLRETIGRWYGKDEELVEAIDIVEQQEVAAPAAPLVIIADADKEAAENLAERVRAEEYEVLVFHDGKKARAACREKAPTVVLLDVALPGIDGYNVLLDLRSRESEAAAFLVSSRNDEFAQAKALELGADDFLAKPLNLEVTTSKIRREVQKRSGTVRRLAAPVSFGGVSGSLEDMTVLDILQSLELGRKSAHVVIQYEDGREGVLGVKLGDLKGGSCKDLVGAEAFYALAKPGPGAFRIEYRSPDVPDTIAQPNTFLMLEALRRLDEADKRDPSIPAPPPVADVPEPPSFSERLAPLPKPPLSAPRAPLGMAAAAPPPPTLNINAAALVGDLDLAPPPIARIATTVPVPPLAPRAPSGSNWTADLPIGTTFPALSPWAQRSPTPMPQGQPIPAALSAPWAVGTPVPSTPPGAPQPAYHGPPSLEAVRGPKTLARVPIQRVASTMLQQKAPVPKPPPPKPREEPEEIDDGSILNPLE
ncbi:MAG: protein kinase [Myxococcota bacterium]